MLYRERNEVRGDLRGRVRVGLVNAGLTEWLGGSRHSTGGGPIPIPIPIPTPTPMRAENKQIAIAWRRRLTARLRQTLGTWHLELIACVLLLKHCAFIHPICYFPEKPIFRSSIE